MNREQLIQTLSEAKIYDLSQELSIFTPPWPGDRALEITFFKRVTGAFGGGQGANGQLISWSNTTGTHLVGERAFHSGGRALADIPLDALMGEGVVADISHLVSDYSIYTPEMIESVVDVKKGDILIVNTGYHRYSFDQPDISNPDAQGGVESKEFGFLVRHPGPSIEFYKWALEMELKIVGVDCGLAEHPMNTPIRKMHAGDFAKAEAKLMAEHGVSWDEMFPPEEYYRLTHMDIPKAHLLFAESIIGQIDELNNQRAWFMMLPLPFMEAESSWMRPVAYRPPEGMSEDDFFAMMASAEVLDFTLPFSVQTPQWANYEPLTVRNHKRVGGQDFGMGRNNAICKASFHLATHMDGEKHFWSRGRTIGQVPLEHWVGPGAIADISHLVSDLDTYTPDMIESVVEVREGDILADQDRVPQIRLEQPRFGRIPLHDPPSRPVARFLGLVRGEEDQMAGHRCRQPGSSHEHDPAHLASQDLRRGQSQADCQIYGKDWDEMYPLDKFYQDTHLNLFPRGIVHAENLGADIAHTPSGRYYLAVYLPKGMETASMWGRFIAIKEG